jgi:DUF1365 family protein
MVISHLYHSQIMHRRHDHLAYQFHYRVGRFCLDLSELTELAKSSRFFSYNRFNLFAFYDKDYGAGDGSPLRPWAEARLAQVGINLEGGQILLYTFPRVLGYQFNPLSLWFCYHKSQKLHAIICEVHNTFWQRHSYILHNHNQALSRQVLAEKAKIFHVSPFMTVNGHYRFRIRPPNGSGESELLKIFIELQQDGQTRLQASEVARKEAWSDAALWKFFWRYPLVTLQVIVGIHWHALKIFSRGGRFYATPPPPKEDIS